MPIIFYTPKLIEYKFQKSMTHNEMVKTFENAKGSIDREILLEVAKDLNLTFSHNVEIIYNSNMQKKSGNNSNPKIINISILFEKGNIFANIKKAKYLSLSIYTNNIKGYTTVNNKDTIAKYELGKSGIKKTFSRNVP